MSFCPCKAERDCPGHYEEKWFEFRGRLYHVNLGAGSVIANYRSEKADKQIRVRIGTELLATGVEKFGALFSAITPG